MDKILCESKAWIGAGLRNGNIKVYKDRIEFYYGKKLVKSYITKKMDIISKNDNGVSTQIFFMYDDKKDSIRIHNDKVNEVLKVIETCENGFKEEQVNTDTTNKSDIKNNKNSKSVGILSFIFSFIFLIFVAYKLNWLSFIGLNTLGINGCYYNESEKDALCIYGKEASFKSVKDEKYYVTYYTSDIKIEDKYGKHITDCKRVKGSKNIVCNNLELHKK